MERLTTWVARLFEALLQPLDLFPERVGLVVISVLSGVLLLVVFGRLTNQRALKEARDRMTSAVYELRLFVDSPTRILSAQLRLLRWSLVYLAHTIPALVVILVPLTILFAHLEARYGLRPVGRSEVLVRLKLRPEADPATISLETGEAEQSAPPVFVATKNELYYRVRARGDANAAMRFHTPSGVVEKMLTGNPASRQVDAARATGAVALLTVGTEGPLPDASSIRELRVQHGQREIQLAGVSAPWWLHWFVISSIAALASKKRLGVVI